MSSLVIDNIFPSLPLFSAFLRQPLAMDQLKERQPSLESNSRLQVKIIRIIAEGTPAIERLSNDLDLIILLSMFENDIMSYVPASARRPSEDVEGAMAMVGFTSFYERCMKDRETGYGYGFEC